MNRTVIFVNTRPTRFEAEPPFWAARSLGLDIIVLGDVTPPVNESLYTEHIHVDSFDYSELRAAAREVATRASVCGVVCWGDRDVVGVAHIAEELGLPGNSVEAAMHARDKYAARALIHEVEPSLVPAFARVLSVTDAENGAAEVPLPAVLKPARASASKGIFTVTTPDEVRSAATELLRFSQPEIDPIFRHGAGELILESFLPGSEHSVDAIVVDGVLVAASVTDKFIDADFSIETAQSQPSTLDGETQDECLRVAQVVVAALGLGTTAIHLEVKVDGSRVRVIELNARTGGGYITTHIIPLSRNYDFLRNVLVAHCQLGEVQQMAPASLAVGSHQYISAKTGELIALVGAERALSIPGVVALFMDSKLGQRVAQPPQSFTSAVICSVLAAAGTTDELYVAMRRAIGELEDVVQ